MAAERRQALQGHEQQQVSRAAAECWLNRLFTRRSNGQTKVPEALPFKWNDTAGKQEIREMFAKARTVLDVSCVSLYSL